MVGKGLLACHRHAGGRSLEVDDLTGNWPMPNAYTILARVCSNYDVANDASGDGAA
jgi:hypothetical protein